MSGPHPRGLFSQRNPYYVWVTARADSVRLNVLISAAGMAALDAIAETEHVDRSTVVRALLSDGVTAYNSGGSAALRRAKRQPAS